jgi:uncharacterized protein YdaU (DUF1376 family)
MHYYKKSIGDYAKKAGKLSMLEHGAYTLLIDSCYDREKFPTERDAMLWTWARTDDEIQAVKFVLNQFFELVDGVYVQNRIKEELAKYHANAKTNKRIATEREEKRKESSRFVGDEHLFEHEPSRSVNEACTNEHEAPPNQEPLTNNHKPLNKEHVHASEDAPILKPEKFKDESQSVFEHWIKVMGKNASTKFTPDRKRLIVRNLKEGYSVDQLKTAIDGCSLSDFNMGREQGKPRQYNDIELILRDAKHIEDFTALKNASSPSTNGNVARTVSEQDQKILDMINAPIQTGRGRK